MAPVVAVGACPSPLRRHAPRRSRSARSRPSTRSSPPSRCSPTCGAATAAGCRRTCCARSPTPATTSSGCTTATGWSGHPSPSSRAPAARSMHSHITGVLPEYQSHGLGRAAQAAPARVGARARRRAHHVDLRPARRPQRALQPAGARHARHRVPRQPLRPDGRRGQPRRRDRPHHGDVGARRAARADADRRPRGRDGRGAARHRGAAARFADGCRGLAPARARAASSATSRTGSSSAGSTTSAGTCSSGRSLSASAPEARRRFRADLPSLGGNRPTIRRTADLRRRRSRHPLRPRLPRMPEYRAHFDFDIRFANGGSLTGTGFRLDLPSRRPRRGRDRPAARASTSGSRSSTRSTCAGLRIVEEPHRGSRGVERRIAGGDGCRDPRRRPQPPDPRRARDLPGPARADHHAAPDPRGLAGEVRAGHRVRDGRHHDDRQHRHLPRLAVPPLRRGARPRGTRPRRRSSGCAPRSSTSRTRGRPSAAASAPRRSPIATCAARPCCCTPDGTAGSAGRSTATGAPFLTGGGRAVAHRRRRGARRASTRSTSTTPSRGGERPAHTLLLGAGVHVVEHLTNLGALPAARRAVHGGAARGRGLRHLPGARVRRAPG